MPITSVRRTSIKRLVITWKALTLMKQDENSSAAPITACGMPMSRS